MAIFSTSQFRQVYVAASLVTPNVAANSALGALSVGADDAESHLYFESMGYGGITRSDLIKLSSVVSAKATDADDMRKPLKRTKIILDGSVNGGVPVAGQDYILRLVFNDPYGNSSEQQYFKYGAVHAVSGMTASTFYKTLAVSLFKNMSKELSPMVKIYGETGGTSGTAVGALVEITASSTVANLTGTFTGIVIEDAEQDWILGRFQQTVLSYAVQPDMIITEGDELIWGVVNTVASTSSVSNGKMMADLEYFALGDRGDTYRNMGFPNSFDTKYMVNPSNNYNAIDITFAYQGEADNIQKSPRTLTILVPKIGASNNLSNVLTNSIITAINNASGLSIDTLDVTAP